MVPLGRDAMRAARMMRFLPVPNDHNDRRQLGPLFRPRRVIFTGYRLIIAKMFADAARMLTCTITFGPYGHLCKRLGLRKLYSGNAVAAPYGNRYAAPHSYAGCLPWAVAE
jgi:hypothetical protein